MRAVGLALAVAACYSPSAPTGAPCTDDSTCPSDQRCVGGACGGTQAAEDAPLADTVDLDATAACASWTAEHFDPCAIPAPGGDLNLTEALSGFNWDTGTGVLKGKMGTTIPVTTMVLTQVDGPEVLLASVASLTLEAGANLDIAGSRSLLIAVWGTASIAGDIDASATFSTPGPGGSSSLTAWCGPGPTGNGGTQGTPATGGGGGAFDGGGGRGGNATSGEGLALATPTIIRGGCAGGVGGGSSGGSNAARGAGGGALQITARTSIAFAASADVDAGGGGGGGGLVAYGGGGGGGAGGYVGLDAPTVTIDGTLAANGGGGGGASDVATGSSGGNAFSSDNAATGGAGAGTSNVGACIKGGNGSSGGTLDAESASSSPCGGGGGGGGAGYILIWSPTLSVTGTVSPPVTAGP